MFSLITGQNNGGSEFQEQRRGSDDSSSGLTLTIHKGLQEIDSHSWNRVVPHDAPTLRYEFLHALETSGAVCDDTGWSPCHLTLAQGNDLVGAVPCYLKSHSYGEFIFDWAWARAYQQSGLDYYPKLVVAVPFTPITGPRLLTHPRQDRELLASTLVQGLRSLGQKLEVSSIHCLFLTESDIQYFQTLDFIDRTSNQFHWRNQQYLSLEHFLQSLSSKKRKNIKRERRRVRDAGINLCWLRGEEISEEQLSFFYTCYRQTIEEHGSFLYLNQEFFETLCQTMPAQIRLLLAQRDSRNVAAAFFVCADNALYGRYWGSVEQIPDLHFEVCYYTPIEYCIEQGFSIFEAGAQGEHKLSRGLMPTITRSAHWLSHAGFHDAIERYTLEEQQEIERYTDILEQHSPFKRT